MQQHFPSGRNGVTMKTQVIALTRVWDNGNHFKPGEEFVTDPERAAQLVRSLTVAILRDVADAEPEQREDQTEEAVPTQTHREPKPEPEKPPAKPQAKPAAKAPARKR
jgi:outer membrane biosynthesis protein TonB